MFKVERIVIKDFAGLGLHDIKEFDFAILKKMMIILGGNGCGKSSFLDIYLPLAPAKTDFRVGGSYVNHCEKDDVKYRCSIKRTEANLVCSIKNVTTGEYICKEVNPKVYNMHIEDIFGLTKEIVEILNGRARLTTANSTLRKAWFSLLSTTDLTYGLKFYKDMRTMHRDLGAVADHLSRKIAEIKLKTVESKEERDAVKARLDEMEQQLQAYSAPAIKELEAYRGSVASPLSAFPHNSALKVANDVQAIPRGLDYSEKGIAIGSAVLDGHSANVARNEGEIKQLNQQLAEYENALQRQSFLMRNHSALQTELERVTAALSHLKASVSELRYTMLLELSGAQLEQAEREFPSVIKNLSALLESISGKYRIKGAEETVESMQNRRAQLAVTIEHCKVRIAEIEHDISHFDQTEDVNCPNCQHSFKPGVIRSKEELFSAHATTMGNLDKAVDELGKLNSDIEPLTRELEAMRGLRNLMLGQSNHPAFGGFFKVLYSDEILTVNRAKLNLYINQFEHEVKTLIELKHCEASYDKLNGDWEDAVRSVGELDPKLLAKVEETRGKLAEATERLEHARQWQRECMEDVAFAKRCQRTVEEFERVQDQLRQSVEASFVEGLWDVLMRNKERLLDTYSSCRTRWSAMESELKQLAELEKEHAEIVEKRHHVSQMIQAWSPEKGVLQRYYFRAISRITMLMTAHIRKCWTYDIKILPCSTEGGDLNYLFPYQLKNKPEPISDIAKTSTGQAEIINLAFRLVAYQALGLSQYPLLLDEPATGFDENHRGKLVSFIKQLVDAGMFSQLLVVSHLSDVHSKLNEAEYCVIEPEGVTLPERYNEAIRIVYDVAE